MIRSILYVGLLGLVAGSCAGRKEAEKNPAYGAELVWIDSVVVESLLDLTLAAVDPIDGRMIFKDRSINYLFLTDSTGLILDTLDIKGEAPDQVAFPFEFVFDGGNLIVKDLEAGMSLNFFNGEFKKIKVSTPLAQGFGYIEFNPRGVSFSSFQIEGKTLIVGTEANGLEPELMAENWKKTEFYTAANVGYLYDSKSDSLHRFNTYPENWEPKKSGKWKGYAFPFVQSLGENQSIGILPRVGSQFFIYRWENSKLVLVSETQLSHPDRNDQLEFDPNDDYFLYPSFYDLKGGGKYFLIKFSTEIPKAVRDEYRIRNPNYNNDPEFNEVYAKYWKEKYILVNQLGESHSLKELPVAGDVHYFDKNDIIYIKPKLEEELDYNVFYRYQIKSLE